MLVVNTRFMPTRRHNHLSEYPVVTVLPAFIDSYAVGCASAQIEVDFFFFHFLVLT